MANISPKKGTDGSTETRIKEAARIVFYRKGFAATRTRDIAEEAGINLALLNYYFRSKQKLFEIIMFEAITPFIGSIQRVLNNEQTTLSQKITAMATQYIDQILKEPEMPIFLLNEIRTNNPKELLAKLPFIETIGASSFIRQYQESRQHGAIVEPNPLHFLMNLMGLIVFPFIAKPILMELNHPERSSFEELMEERKRLIPICISAIMQAK